MARKLQRRAWSGVRNTDRQAHYRDLSVVYEGYSDEITIRVPDLSPSGMFINTPRRFPEGAVLNLSFTLARSGYRVKARGEVRFCLPDIGIGVEFVLIDPDAQQAIQDEIER